MPTKAELEAENAALARKITRLARVVDDLHEAQKLQPPSPVDRGQLYVESHPILGVLKKATVTSQSFGDGRIGDGATIVRERYD